MKLKVRRARGGVKLKMSGHQRRQRRAALSQQTNFDLEPARKPPEDPARINGRVTHWGKDCGTVAYSLRNTTPHDHPHAARVKFRLTEVKDCRLIGTRYVLVSFVLVHRSRHSFATDIRSCDNVEEELRLDREWEAREKSKEAHPYYFDLDKHFNYTRGENGSCIGYS